MAIPTAKRLLHEGKNTYCHHYKQTLHHKYSLVLSGTVAPCLGLSGHLGHLASWEAQSLQRWPSGMLPHFWHAGTLEQSDRPMAQAHTQWWLTQTPQFGSIWLELAGVVGFTVDMRFQHWLWWSKAEQAQWPVHLDPGNQMQPQKPKIWPKLIKHKPETGLWLNPDQNRPKTRYFWLDIPLRLS